MGKLELNKKQKKAALYTAAYELFVSKGFARTTISDIVEQAGVAKGTFYLYFKDKYDIHDKLIAHKTAELFYRSQEALKGTGYETFEEQFYFTIHFILDELEKNTPLLLFISKNLSWGVFRCFFHPDSSDVEYPFYRSYLNLLSKSSRSYRDPEIMLFTIIELVGSTCHSCILYSQPLPIQEYKPYLYRAIAGIMESFSVEEAGHQTCSI